MHNSCAARLLAVFVFNDHCAPIFPLSVPPRWTLCFLHRKTCSQCSSLYLDITSDIRYSGEQTLQVEETWLCIRVALLGPTASAMFVSFFTVMVGERQFKAVNEPLPAKRTSRRWQGLDCVIPVLCAFCAHDLLDKSCKLTPLAGGVTVPEGLWADLSANGCEQI